MGRLIDERDERISGAVVVWRKPSQQAKSHAFVRWGDRSPVATSLCGRVELPERPPPAREPLDRCKACLTVIVDALPRLYAIEGERP